MAFRASRRLFCFLAALLFALSSVGHVYATTEALMKMPAAAMESSMSDHGMDCGGSNDKGARANCMAMCATSFAILSEPITIPVVVVLQDVESITELPPPERGLLPEPHPPKR
jgi:archaellum component FlaG (FlaF/FlaG flagellin family)